MARSRDAHPLGKCSLGKRLDLALPDPLNHRLQIIAAMYGKTPTTWARDVLEKEIEGEWVFMRRRRRLGDSAADDNGTNSR